MKKIFEDKKYIFNRINRNTFSEIWGLGQILLLGIIIPHNTNEILYYIELFYERKFLFIFKKILNNISYHLTHKESK